MTTFGNAGNSHLEAEGYLYQCFDAGDPSSPNRTATLDPASISSRVVATLSLSDSISAPLKGMMLLLSVRADWEMFTGRPEIEQYLEGIGRHLLWDLKAVQVYR